MEESKTTLRSFRFTAAEGLLIDRAAKKLKMTRSAFFRFAVYGVAKKTIYGDSVLSPQKPAGEDDQR